MNNNNKQPGQNNNQSKGQATGQRNAQGSSENASRQGKPAEGKSDSDTKGGSGQNRH
ncbi:MAG TPA: hypothetical protein PK484_08960 [Novosphingobium sp.]|jgi:hypothetical protein|nr:hypothetical protein [Novosphingobium sp.]